jgi:hypothetical protein
MPVVGERSEDSRFLCCHQKLGIVLESGRWSSGGRGGFEGLWLGCQEPVEAR